MLPRIHSLGFLLLTVAIPGITVGQNGGCPNLGFDQGDFSHWTGGTGSCCPIDILGQNLVMGRHTIMSGPGTDPNTDDVITVVAPGGGPYSARLGNPSTGAQAERLRYSMLVDASNALFVYRYAVILEDPMHEDEDQPRFEIRMFDETGGSIDCGMYNVYSTSGIPGFVSITNQFGQRVNYKDWTTVGMDLTPFIGQTVTIEFATGDCALGGHYGYAYIDCYCSPLTINAGFCPGLDSATLTAPEGFAAYLWSNGATTPSITVNGPAVGDLYACTLTSVTGCNVTISTQLEHSVVSAHFSVVDSCSNHVAFTDSSFALSGPPVNGWYWDFGDGSTSGEADPIHGFAAYGDHWVRLLAWAVPECPDTIEMMIGTMASPQAAFSFDAPCYGLPVELHDSTSSVLPVLGIEWNFGDGSPTGTGSHPLHLYGQPAEYEVRLVAFGNNGCNDTLVQTVPVLPAFAVELGPDTGFCIGTPWTLDAGNPGRDFLWNTGDTAQTIALLSSGTYWVVVTDTIGCMGSDTTLVVFDAPPVVQLPDTSLCPGSPLVLDAGSPGATYLWNTGQTTPSITVPEQTGVYSVTVTSPHGCSEEFHAHVHYHPAAPVYLGPDQGHCIGDTVMLSITPVPAAAYTWSTGSHDTSAAFHQSATVWLSATLGVCITSDTVQLTFDPMPTVHLTDTVLCASEVLVLDAGHPGFDHQWSMGDTGQIVQVYNVSGPISLSITSPGGCTANGNMLATFMPEVHVDLGADQLLCAGDSVILTAGTDTALEYTWSNGSKLPATWFSATTTVVVAITNGYCTDSDTVQITFNPYPGHAPVLEMDTCFEDPRDVLILQADAGAAFHEWSTGEIAEAIQVYGPGEYWVLSGNLPDCNTVDTIRVGEYCRPQLFIPNAFTPNDDGYNDRFTPVGDNIRTVEFAIFNRSGDPVFIATEDGASWDGRYEGRELPLGVYNWRFIYRPIRKDGRLGLQEVEYGHVSLVR